MVLLHFCISCITFSCWLLSKTPPGCVTAFCVCIGYCSPVHYWWSFFVAVGSSPSKLRSDATKVAFALTQLTQGNRSLYHNQIRFSPNQLKLRTLSHTRPPRTSDWNKVHYGLKPKSREKMQYSYTIRYVQHVVQYLKCMRRSFDSPSSTAYNGVCPVSYAF